MSEWKIAGFRERDLEDEAAALYSDALPYHNFGHVLTTLESAEEILGRCAQEGIRVDGRIVYLSLLFHDAGYQHDHRDLGHPTKEHYSAALATDCLQRRRHGPQLIRKVELAILGTMRGGRFDTAEQKAVRAADLAGLAAVYDIFLGNTIRLWHEHEVLTGCRMPWTDWVASTQEIVRHYLSQEIRLTSFYLDTNGKSAFHELALRNLERLGNERAPAG